MIQERLARLDVVDPGALADQDVNVLDGSPYSLVNDVRYTLA